ncbi:MAG: bifunctional diaminohydroxyphosphoribosylaminopyrimidine deaminase/5-amino-6-(5-phosphoribosylamino)uracil reductase RibD [Rudaea sp.]
MTEFSAIDHAHMARALRLAERGLYTTQPNPRVGCVIARGDEIISEGWHARAGEPHAEVLALRDAAERARAATAYVTLEPCAHFGKTPPCADALVAAGIGRVVAACDDPNPRVAGGGFKKLRDAGIPIDIGLMREAAREMNRGFFSRIERGRPWVRVKLASSLDGRTALSNGASKWITSEFARADVQRWRARSSALLTGSGTVLADDPKLTVRIDSAFKPPLRVVLDRQLKTPRHSHVLDVAAPTLVIHAQDAMPDDRFAHVELVTSPMRDGLFDLSAVLTHLAERGVNELQVEAGPTLSGAFVAQNLADEILLYTAPVLLGDRARPLLALPALDDMTNVHRLHVVERRQIGEDTRLLLRR